MIDEDRIHVKIDNLNAKVEELTERVIYLIGKLDVQLPTFITRSSLSNKLAEHTDKCKRDSRWSTVAKLVVSVMALTGAISLVIQVLGK